MPPQVVVVSGFSVKVNPVPVPPLAISPPTGSPLPDETVGQAAHVDLTTVSSGTPPYSAAPINGSLPAGMSIGQRVNQVTGAVTFFLSGTPTAPASDSFDLQITDSTP